MDTKSFMDFESATDMVAKIYFFGGFCAGLAFCAFVIAVFYFLKR